METNRIILHGGGEHARVVLDCLLSAGEKVVALFDPKYSGELMGVPQRGSYNPEMEPNAMAIVAIGDNTTRKKAVSRTGHKFINAIHPSALMSSFASIGEGNMILHKVIIQAFARIGNHVILNTGAQVDHDCVIADYVHLAPGVILCGTVQVDEGSLVGAGAIVTPGKKIGKWSVIGAGSVVIDDIPDFSVAVGNPAKVIKKIHHE